jgi:hypothetical protein
MKTFLQQLYYILIIENDTDHFFAKHNLLKWKLARKKLN